jgi:plastocyanin
MRRALVVLIALGLGTTACSSKSDAKSFSVTTSEPSAGKVAIAAPATVAAGLVEIKFKNSGKQPHDLQLVRIEGDHAVEQVLEVVGSESAPIPTWLHAEGGVGGVAPGKSSTATMDLPAGKYYLIDTNSDENDNSFAKQGGVRELTVTGQSEGKALPSADVTISAREYEFTVPAIKAGTSTVKFQNTGKELHMVIALPILPGKTFADVKAAFASQDANAQPPVDFENATGSEVIDNGKALVTKMTFKKGSYAFICFVNDRAGGPPHFTKGMFQEVKVA